MGLTRPRGTMAPFPLRDGVAMNPITLNRLLATVTLAAAGTAFAAPAAGPGGGMMMFGGPQMGRMLERVGATAEQRAQVEKIAEAARADLRALRENGRGLRDQAQQLFVQPVVDEAAAESLRQQMLAQHDKASQRSLQALLEISRVLTPEQRQQLSELMKQRRGGMHQHPRAGRG
jgi:Spy/CpxP family protein refolding chaperone